MERVIFHCDLNSFFASVELLSRPELREKPVAVGGDQERRHGIILAKNEQAKAFGVKTAETIWQAKSKCPELIVLPSHHSKYEKYSQAVTDKVERKNCEKKKHTGRNPSKPEVCKNISTVCRIDDITPRRKREADTKSEERKSCLCDNS